MYSFINSYELIEFAKLFDQRVYIAKAVTYTNCVSKQFYAFDQSIE